MKNFERRQSGDIDVPADLGADGSLFEIVRLDGTWEGLSDAELGKFIESFPAERVWLARPQGLAWRTFGEISCEDREGC